VTISVLLVGAGAIAPAHVRAVRGEGERAVLKGVVDRDRTTARTFAADHGISAAYDDLATALEKEHPDLVLICTPPALHADQCVKALSSGAWVLCEKPLCASLAELDRIIRAEQESRCYCSVIAQRRFSGVVRHIKGLIEGDVLGAPIAALCATTWFRDAAYYRVPWRGTWAQETGGVTMNLGVHLIDLLLHLFGRWRDVRGVVTTRQRAIEVDNLSAGVVTFENGAVGSLLNSALSPRQETYLRLDFERATLETRHLYDFTAKDWTCYSSEAAVMAAWEALEDDSPADHAAQFRALLADMEAGTPPLMRSAGAARETLEFVTAFYKAGFGKEIVQRGAITPDDPFYRGMNGAAL